MKKRTAAEVFPPSAFIEEELEARNWKQADLAEIMGRSPAEISALMLGKRAISPEIAVELGAAFGTSAKVWMNLEATYQLHRLEGLDSPISRRARLHGRWPIREMVKRHWLEPSENIDVLEQRVKRFLGVDTLDAPVTFRFAARKATQEVIPAHTAWLCRAKQLSRAVHAEPFSQQSFSDGLNQVKTLLPNAPDVRRVSAILAEAGVRFLVVQHLPGTKIDGATFWLDENRPVIALSLRYDRIDSFWFTLAHELGHVSRQDGIGEENACIDVDLFAEDKIPAEQESDEEKAANSFAEELLIDQSKLDDFIGRVRPLYSGAKIIGFATLNHVHPGIVVGQLQKRKEIGWNVHTRMLGRIRDIVTQSTLTDGWGHVPPPMN